MRLTLLSFSPSPPHPLPSPSFLSLLLFVPLSWPLSPCKPSPHTENDQPSLVWFDRGKFYLTFEGKLCLHRLVCAHTLLKLICASSPLSCPALSFPFFPHSPLHHPTHVNSWQCPTDSAAWFSFIAFSWLFVIIFYQTPKESHFCALICLISFVLFGCSWFHPWGVWSLTLSDKLSFSSMLK